MSKRGIGSSKAAQAARDHAKAQKAAKKAKAAEKQARIEAALNVAEEIKAEGTTLAFRNGEAEFVDPLTDESIPEIELTETFDA